MLPWEVTRKTKCATQTKQKYVNLFVSLVQSLIYPNGYSLKGITYEYVIVSNVKRISKYTKVLPFACQNVFK